MKESLIGSSIIQQWTENWLCIVALHLFQRGERMEGSEECRPVQGTNSQSCEEDKGVLPRTRLHRHMFSHQKKRAGDNEMDNLQFSVGKKRDSSSVQVLPRQQEHQDF